MILFEITNGYIGESYVRAYAWAPSQGEAVALCVATNGPGNYTARALFEDSTPPFCTVLKDDGWPENYAYLRAAVDAGRGEETR